MNPFFREVAIRMATKQTVMVDAVTEEAPILAKIPMEPSSHGLWNLYESLNDVVGGDIVDLDAPLPTISSDSTLNQKDLSALGGIMTVGEDKARKFGGKEAYFAKKMPSILRKTGMDMESNLLYNVLRSFAYANGKVQFGGGSGSTNYSILCVHWVPGEVTGLYDKQGFGDGKAFDLAPINGGNMYQDENKVLVYGLRLKTYFGMQLANKVYISGIVNCDIASDAPSGTRTFPTVKMIDDMILSARGGANTFIYCHPAVKSYLGTVYKLEKMQVVNSDNQIRTAIESWNDIPIVTSYNFLPGTESRVSS